MGILVIDAGTSGIRAAVVNGDASVSHEHYVEALPDSPEAGIVEFDAAAYAAAALDLARRVVAEAGAGSIDGVGISSQRGTTVVWDRATGEPVAPAQGWQDLRTLGDCLVLAAEGVRIAPNQSATKVANILDAVDPGRERDLCFGTPDTWLVWKLTGGATHVTDLSNAAITGLVLLDGSGWDPALLERLRIPASMMPAIVDSSGAVGEATALDGSPAIAGFAGDQQCSLIGQGCVRPGLTKITFGTGGMLDACVGPDRPDPRVRAGSGTFPIVCWQRGGETMWGMEGLILSAGTNVQWLRDDLGIIDTAEQSAAVAAGCETTDGVVFVPAQLGIGTPHWDYGARGLLIGLTRGTGRPEVVRAVLEGVAHRGADLVDAAEADSGLAIGTLRIDGGMSENEVFCQALANATGRPVEVSPVKEATGLGAGFLAGLALGTWSGWDDLAATWTPARVVEPTGQLDRDRWQDAVSRSRGWFSDLSALDF